MPAALAAAYPVYAATDAPATTLTTPSFTPAAGEVLVLKVQGENGVVAFGTPVGGGLTWTQRRLGNTTNLFVYGAIWTAVVGAGGAPMTVAITRTGANTGWTSMVVERYTGAQLAATPEGTTSNGTGAPTGTVTTTAADSIVSWLSGDWNAVAPGSRAYRSGATERGMHDRSPNNYVGYFATQAAAAAGAQTCGLTAPAGQKYTLLAIEVQSAPSGGGTAHTAGASQAVTSTGTASTVRSAAAAAAQAVTAAMLAAAARITAAQASLTITADPTAGAVVGRMAATYLGVTATISAVATVGLAGASASAEAVATATAGAARATSAQVQTTATATAAATAAVASHQEGIATIGSITLWDGTAEQPVTATIWDGATELTPATVVVTT